MFTSEKGRLIGRLLVTSCYCYGRRYYRPKTISPTLLEWKEEYKPKNKHENGKVVQ